MPGEQVEISLKTAKNSAISFCIVDKSVELLGPEPNEMTLESVRSRININQKNDDDNHAYYGYHIPKDLTRLIVI